MGRLSLSLTGDGLIKIQLPREAKEFGLHVLSDEAREYAKFLNLLADEIDRPRKNYEPC